MTDFVNVKTDPNLLRRVNEIAGQPISHIQIEEQRASFIQSVAGGNLSRMQIKAILVKQERRA